MLPVIGVEWQVPNESEKNEDNKVRFGETESRKRAAWAR